jgi:hypothetical protein
MDTGTEHQSLGLLHRLCLHGVAQGFDHTPLRQDRYGRAMRLRGRSRRILRTGGQAMSRSDNYVTLHLVLKTRTDKAVLFADSDGTEAWVPRSCMHFQTDRAVADAAIGNTIEARIMEWVAQQRGLI